ncbi:MAG TPA: peptide-methionine (S)-S-oxide reductase MsrA [Gemmataceae bacterium]|nr:peptide-methionine (S)-S-oxide reductase MsrA [Gemmataceae bacterium]
MSNDNAVVETATLGGGCFWCLEAVFENLRGVLAVVSGYTAGQTSDPIYRDVCSGTTGHAEVVQVTFDPRVVSFADILDIFFSIHDPTTLNRQGNDVGTQYRSGIYYHSPEQKEIAEAKIAQLNATQLFNAPIVSEVKPATRFYRAEDYHQGYFRAHPEQGYCQFVVSPKVAKFRKQFVDRLKA